MAVTLVQTVVDLKYTGVQRVVDLGVSEAGVGEPVGWFETTANTLLNLELGGAVQVSGHLTYIEV